MIWNISLQSALLSSIGVSSPKLYCSPSLLAGRVARDVEKSFTLCKYCSTMNKNISGLAPLFSLNIQNTVWYKLLWRKLTVSQPKPQQTLKSNVVGEIKLKYSSSSSSTRHLFVPWFDYIFLLVVLIMFLKWGNLGCMFRVGDKRLNSCPIRKGPGFLVHGKLNLPPSRGRDCPTLLCAVPPHLDYWVQVWMPQ